MSDLPQLSQVLFDGLQVSGSVDDVSHVPPAQHGSAALPQLTPPPAPPVGSPPLPPTPPLLTPPLPPVGAPPVPVAPTPPWAPAPPAEICPPSSP
jgi:hypothetical protein